MVLPVILSPGRMGFSPKCLSGLALWLDANHLTGLADNDVVGTWTDLSGNGRNATAAGAARPTYKTGILKGKPVLRFNGTANAMQTAAVDFTATQTMTVFAVVIPDTTAANRVIVELGNGSTTGFYCYHSQDGGGFNNSFSAGLLGDVGFSYEYNRCVILNTPAVVTGTYDKSSATHETYCYVNGSLAGAYTGSNNTNNFGNLALNIGSRNAASLWYKGDIAEIIIYNRTLTSTELARVHSYLLNKWMTSCIYGPSELADNAYSNSYTAYTLSSPFARTVFTTTATMLTVDVYNNIFSTFSTYATIGVLVDGVYTTTLTSLVDSTQTSFSIVLAGGLKTVVLVNGLQTKPGATVLGTFVTKVWSGNGVMTKSAPARSTLVVYGDSITIGGNATIPTSQAWVILVRAAYTGTMAIEAWGFRSLHDDAVDAPARAAFVARMAAAYSPTKIWLAIGFNDYYLTAWAAASFGTAYAALLDALHAQFPAAIIYAQTMIDATDEADHGVGTLGAFRTQIATAQGTRSAWCTLVDGTAASFPQAPGDLDDGIHPTTAGHVMYSDAVKTVLGI